MHEAVNEPPTDSDLRVDFAGEITDIAPGEEFFIGRDGNLDLDDNPYLHRQFLRLAHTDGLWWVENCGSRLPAGLSDERGLMRSTLGPGARLPVVFPRSSLTFAAGSTSYELLLHTRVDGFEPQTTSPQVGDTTINPPSFTESQLQAILALAEPVLRRAGSGASAIPSSVDAARRLGWTQTRFNRKLDNVCEKLDAVGVAGLRGTGSSMAGNRRVRLVEYAVSTLLVTSEDLSLLDRPPGPYDEDKLMMRGNAP